jgi:mono/diheme cytochrome c family protein
MFTQTLQTPKGTLMRRSILCNATVGLVALFGWLAATSANDEKQSVTFTKDIAPILFKHCAGCHRPDASAPMSLLSYKDARPWARSIKEKVLTRAMPPWGADPHFGEFANDTSLAQRDIDTIAAWVDQGAKEGDPRALPPAPTTATQWALGNPDLVLAMQQEWTGEATGLDDNVEFSVSTGFTEDKWVQAVEFRPGNKRVVHHAVVLIQTPEMLKTAQTSTSDSNEGIFRVQGTNRQVRDDVRVVDDGCSLPSGGGGGNNARFALTVYGPGRNADSWPAGTAKLIPAGSKLIFQMHYSKATGKPEKDRSSVALVFARKPVEKMVVSTDIMNFYFRIPAGAANHEVTACSTFKKDVQIVSLMPHMHVRGKDMKYEAIYPDGRRVTLLSVPRYNFYWQTLYQLKQPLAIPQGTRIVVTAHFDNSPRNKYNPDATRAVRYGDSTNDEMLAGFVDYLTEKPPAVRPIAKLDPATYDTYVGEYLVGSRTCSVVREDDKLWLVAPGWMKAEALPESETKFFLRAMDAQMTFVRNEKGEVTGFVFEMGNRTMQAKKVAASGQKQ